MKRVIWTLLLIAPVAALAAPAPAGGAGLTDRIDAFIRDEMRREQVPGVAVGIVRGSEVLVSKGYGEANVELHAPVTEHTLFQSGSIGKQFTATALMLQVQDGKVGLDDPVARYLPGAPAGWQAIKVRNLLTHTSGIPDYEDASEPGSPTPIIDYRRDYTEQELTRLAYRLPLDFEPGTRWRYSNTGFLLLGVLIHEVSGQFYGDVLKARVFERLGMRSARIISEADIVEGRAAGYRLVDGALKNQEWVAPSLNTTADGSLYLSVTDLLAWDRGLRARALLSPQSWQEIYTPVVLRSGRSYPYGFGWDVEEAKGRPWYHHGGTWQGFRTYISRYLADDLSIIVLCNLADAEPRRFVDGIATLIDPQLPRIQPISPIPDREPAVTARARALLLAAQSGSLRAADFPYLHAAFAALAADQHKLLAGLGAPQPLVLVDRRALGDDRAYTYLAQFTRRTLRMSLELTADERIAELDLEPEVE